MVGRPSGTVTFVFTDTEASTLWEMAPEAMREALAVHDFVVRTAIKGSGEGYSAKDITGRPADCCAVDGDASRAGVGKHDRLALAASRCRRPKTQASRCRGELACVISSRCRPPVPATWMVAV